MTPRETNLLRAAKAMLSAIQAQDLMTIQNIIECLDMPAKEIDAAIWEYAIPARTMKGS